MGFRGISDAEADRLLAGDSNGGDPEARIGETAAFLRMARTALLEQPSPKIEADLVRRLAETARLGAASRATRPARPIIRSRGRLVAKLAVAMALVPAALAGLAFAGVTLPGAANSAFDSVGVNLPNQEDGDDADGGAAPAGPASEQPSSSKGTQSTQGNSDAAHQHALEQRKKARGEALGHNRGKAIGLNDLEPPGQSGDAGSPAHSNAGGYARKKSAPEKAKDTIFPRLRGRGMGLTK